MPELPEVEITLRGLAPHLVGQRVAGVAIRHPQLRWPIPANLSTLLTGQTIRSLTRRAKYLLAGFDHGTLILHLGMSGSLRILPDDIPPEKHDHFDLLLANGTLMRLRDPRRFGAVLWCTGDPALHPLLAELGPEPQGDEFSARYLHQVTRGRKSSIKQCLMDNHIVVGIGNIYANEALFLAGIRPQLAAGRLSLPRCASLVEAIRAILAEAIRQGGSTLRDFVNAAGQPGYFHLNFWVYSRGGEPCRKCGTLIRQLRQGQRASYYCPHCQK